MIVTVSKDGVSAYLARAAYLGDSTGLLLDFYGNKQQVSDVNINNSYIHRVYNFPIDWQPNKYIYADGQWIKNKGKKNAC